MKKLLTFVCCIMSTYFYSQSNDRWSHIGDTKSGVSYYIADIKDEPDGSKAFWLKCLELNNSPKKRKGEYTIVKWIISCEDKQYKLGYYVEYDSKGKTLRSIDLDTQYQDIIPDSMGEKVYNYICEKD